MPSYKLEPGNLYAYTQVVGDWNLICRYCNTQMIRHTNWNSQLDTAFICVNCSRTLHVSKQEIEREITEADNGQPTHWPVHTI